MSSGWRGDRDGLGLLADVQAHVDAAGVVRAERQRLLLVGLEAGELDLEVVGAGNRPASRYWPRSSLTAVCTRLVPVLVTVTVAPGRTPPLGSWTVPRMVAVVEPCANAVVLVSSQRACGCDAPHSGATSGVPYSPVEPNSTIYHS